jgi:membrane peptidoglycan carboxypeptidase
MGHEISVTSLQLAQLGGIIANGGFLVHPRLVAWEQAAGQERIIAKPNTRPVQVLRPETVMTMRQLMHRVTIKGGTAPNLHVPGYLLAGKTGTAQIYDYDHHVYTHKYNASFMGFAPLENPAVVVVVTVSGTTGTAGFGGAAAGPVFERVMGTALRRLGVVRDVPQEIEELVAKEKATEEKLHPRRKSSEEDADTVAALSDPPTPQELQAASSEGDGTSVLITDPNAPKVPDFVGKSVKDAMEIAASSGIEIDLSGSGLARAQSPRAGSALTPGERVEVKFAR